MEVHQGPVELCDPGENVRFLKGTLGGGSGDKRTQTNWGTFARRLGKEKTLKKGRLAKKSRRVNVMPGPMVGNRGKEGEKGRSGGQTRGLQGKVLGSLITKACDGRQRLGRKTLVKLKGSGRSCKGGSTNGKSFCKLGDELEPLQEKGRKSN